MESYLFFFGRSPALSLSECAAYFPTYDVLTDSIVRIQAPHLVHNGQTVPMADTLQILGGTTKVAVCLGMVSEVTPESIGEFLSPLSKERLTFGISSYTPDVTISSRFLQSVKERLGQEGKAVRFLLAQHGETLSAVAVSKQHVFEINICREADHYIVAKTIAVQAFDAWNDRDYGRPFADPKSGMLPPKVARMMAGIALGITPGEKILLDPFCGMGTILGEAALLGAKGVIGSDYLPDVVEKAQANSAWLTARYPHLVQPHFYTSDATHISLYIEPSSVDAIVTEPFMGSNKMGEGKITDKEKLRNIMKGLEKLYKGCLKDWYPVLKPDGVIVIAFPEVAVGNTVYGVKKVIDSCETLGYTLRNGPIPYGRPHAIVKRMIYEFRKL